MRAYDLEVTGSLVTTGSLKVIGDITAEQYQIRTTVTQVTMSAASGSMIFGDSIDDTHQITGSTTTSGSINVRNGELQVGGTIVPTGTAVSSSFAQKSAVSSSFAQKSAVSSSFAQKSAVSGSFVTSSAFTGNMGDISGSSISTGSFGSTNIMGNLNIGTTTANVSQSVDIGLLGTGAGITISGSILPAGDDKHDLGSLNYQWRDIYTGDFHLKNTGREEGNVIDGTKGDWTIQEGREDLYLLNNETGKKFKFKLEEIE